jgi:ribosomal protein S28E/S33
MTKKRKHGITHSAPNAVGVELGIVNRTQSRILKQNDEQRVMMTPATTPVGTEDIPELQLHRDS